jgi:hypothetical protein
MSRNSMRSPRELAESVFEAENASAVAGLGAPPKAANLSGSARIGNAVSKGSVAIQD